MGLETVAVEERCRELGIEVRDGHLTTLAADDAERVRKALREHPATGVTQKRVGSTVVRRRRTVETAAVSPRAAAGGGATAPVRRRRAGNDEPAAEAPVSARSNRATETPAPPAEAPKPAAPKPVEAPPVIAEAPPVETPAPAPVEPPVAAEAPRPPQPAAETPPAPGPAEAPPVASEPPTAAPVAPTSPPVEAPARAAAAAPAAASPTAEPAEEAAPQPLAQSNYTDEEAVNAGGTTTEDLRERQSFVKVVRRLDADLTQHLINEAQRRAQRSASPPPRRSGPGRTSRPGTMPPPGAPGAPAAPGAPGPGPAPGGDDRRRKGRHGSRVRWEASRDRRFDDRGSRMRGKRGRGGVKKGVRITEGSAVPKASKRVVKMEETITVGELASQLAVKASEIIKALMDLGEMVTVNNVLDLDTVTLIAQEYQFTVENVAFDIENYIPKADEGAKELPRDPVVTVMGHVDHGKTSLLDFIRKARVAAGEAGGITQHIGAYKVPVGKGKKKRSLVFLDTPGHAAFTEMRARGANVTDVVILVVAADDGVMPQTIEAINHSKAAGVPVVVAVNKIDKEDAQPERIRQQMTEHGLVSEEWGGDTQFVNVSAKTGEGIDALLEGVLLQADVLELKAVTDRPATGVVVEAELSKGRGPVATVLVQEGTLKKGDIVVAGKATGRVRAIIDDRGRQLKSAGPATPVEVLGLNEVPPPSERFFAVKDEKDAKVIVSHLEDKDREKRLAEERKRVSLDDLFDQMKAGEVKSLNLIIKSDVQGSLEALKTSFNKLKHPELEVRIIHDAVGAISESDVTLASASNGIIIGFNVRPEKNAKAMAEQDGVEIKLYSVIYNAVDDVKAAMEGMLSPNIEERLVGKAAIRDTFGVPKLGTIAGCAVLQGKLIRNARARLIRDGRVIADTKLDSLRRFKDNVTEVDRGHECGAHLENYNDIKVGDEIECYELIEVAQTLDI